jgi:hypothetical protein
LEFLGIRLKCIVCPIVVAMMLLSTQAGLVAQKEPCAVPAPAKDDKYVPGQVWSYKTRPGESLSTVTILRVESLPKAGVVIHVRIDGIQFKNCTGGPAPSRIEHAPFARKAIDESTTRLLRTESAVPDHEVGYQDWLVHCGGVYTIGLAQMVDVDDAAFNAGLGCKA